MIMIKKWGMVVAVVVVGEGGLMGLGVWMV